MPPKDMKKRGGEAVKVFEQAIPDGEDHYLIRTLRFCVSVSCHS